MLVSNVYLCGQGAKAARRGICLENSNVKGHLAKLGHSNFSSSHEFHTFEGRIVGQQIAIEMLKKQSDLNKL